MATMLATRGEDHAGQFAARGFAHVSGAVRPEILTDLVDQVDRRLREQSLEEYAIGDKHQAMFDFDEPAYLDEIADLVAAVTGLDRSKLILSERHIKVYDDDAAPDPPLHKDRFASQISLGVSLRVPVGSTLVIYPDDETDVNPYNSSTEYRQSLTPDRYPEGRLPEAGKLEIQDRPGDVVLFRGHSMWHRRTDGANTAMLYLKFNVLGADPLGEDPGTGELRRMTEAVLAGDDAALLAAVPGIGRRVDYFQRRYTRDWRESLGVALYRQPVLGLDEPDLAILRAVDGVRPAAELLGDRDDVGRADGIARIRRLAAASVLDLRTTSRS